MPHASTDLEVSLDEVTSLRGLDGAVVVVVELLVEGPDGGQAHPVLHSPLQGGVLQVPVHPWACNRSVVLRNFPGEKIELNIILS